MEPKDKFPVVCTCTPELPSSRSVPFIESNTKFPEEAKVAPVPPSCVNLISLPAPNANLAPSESKDKSLPITASKATDKPPSVCNEPSVVLVAFVSLSVFNTPEKVPVVAVRA